MNKQEKSPGGNLGQRRGRGTAPRQYSTTNGAGRSNEVELIYDRRGRMVGEVNGTGEARQFQKHLKRSLHFLEKFNAFAWDEVTLDQAERAGARRVLIVDSDSGQWYRASMRTVRDKGFRLPFDEGQIALRLSHFRTRDEAAQLALFDGGSS